MGNWVTDFFNKKAEKREEKKSPDSPYKMNIKKYSNTITFSDLAPGAGQTAAQVHMQNAHNNMQLAKQMQQQTTHLTAQQVAIQQQQLQQMIRPFGVPSKPEPENAVIRDCHCNDGCWDCNGSKVMAIPPPSSGS